MYKTKQILSSSSFLLEGQLTRSFLQVNPDFQKILIDTLLSSSITLDEKIISYIVKQYINFLDKQYDLINNIYMDIEEEFPIKYKEQFIAQLKTDPRLQQYNMSEIIDVLNKNEKEIIQDGINYLQKKAKKRQLIGLYKDLISETINKMEMFVQKIEEKNSENTDKSDNKAIMNKGFVNKLNKDMARYSSQITDWLVKYATNKTTVTPRKSEVIPLILLALYYWKLKFTNRLAQMKNTVQREIEHARKNNTEIDKTTKQDYEKLLNIINKQNFIQVTPDDIVFLKKMDSVIYAPAVIRSANIEGLHFLETVYHPDFGNIEFYYINSYNADVYIAHRYKVTFLDENDPLFATWCTAAESERGRHHYREYSKTGYFVAVVEDTRHYPCKAQWHLPSFTNVYKHAGIYNTKDKINASHVEDIDYYDENGEFLETITIDWSKWTKAINDIWQQKAPVYVQLAKEFRSSGLTSITVTNYKNIDFDFIDKTHIKDLEVLLKNYFNTTWVKKGFKLFKQAVKILGSTTLSSPNQINTKIISALVSFAQVLIEYSDSHLQSFKNTDMIKNNPNIDLQKVINNIDFIVRNGFPNIPLKKPSIKISYIRALINFCEYAWNDVLTPYGQYFARKILYTKQWTSITLSELQYVFITYWEYILKNNKVDLYEEFFEMFIKHILKSKTWKKYLTNISSLFLTNVSSNNIHTIYNIELLFKIGLLQYFYQHSEISKDTIQEIESLLFNNKIFNSFLVILNLNTNEITPDILIQMGINMTFLQEIVSMNLSFVQNKETFKYSLLSDFVSKLILYTKYLIHINNIYLIKQFFAKKDDIDIFEQQMLFNNISYLSNYVFKFNVLDLNPSYVQEYKDIFLQQFELCTNYFLNHITNINRGYISLYSKFFILGQELIKSKEEKPFIPNELSDKVLSMYVNMPPSLLSKIENSLFYEVYLYAVSHISSTSSTTSDSEETLLKTHPFFLLSQQLNKEPIDWDRYNQYSIDLHIHALSIVIKSLPPLRLLLYLQKHKQQIMEFLSQYNKTDLWGAIKKYNIITLLYEKLSKLMTVQGFLQILIALFNISSSLQDIPSDILTMEFPSTDKSIGELLAEYFELNKNKK